MLKNYIMTAWKVFLRRKFFTFVNLFGICLTLTIIMVALTLLDSFVYPDGPGRHSDNYRIIHKLVLTNKEHNNTQSSRLGYKFIQDNVLRLKEPEVISYFTRRNEFNRYVDDRKYTLVSRYTDANYWKVLDFQLQEGRFYEQAELDKGEFVAVVSSNIAKEFYSERSAIGQSFDINGVNYTIIGVVETPPLNDFPSYSHIWVPYTTQPSSTYQQQTLGNWEVILYHSDSSRMDRISQEYAHLLEHDVVLSGKGGYVEAYGGAFDKIDSIARGVFSREFEFSYDSGKELLLTILLIITLLFMALPAINLINLNISRTLERSSEIGVRKAFGASSKHLVGQFIVENLLLTLAGGLLAMALSIFLLSAFENSGLIPFAKFGFSIRVFLLGLVAILIFGLISGCYPAYKMSRMHPVSALKGA